MKKLILGVSGALLFFSLLVLAATTTIRPDANGIYTQWTPVGCGTNYQCVDESVPSTNDSVETYLANKSDVYGLQYIHSLNITSLVLSYYAREYNTTARYIVPLMVINNTDYYGSLINLTKPYVLYNQT
ncbi:MAG: hypothetical protein AABY09_05540, partial [Nanoarchaeota archaeon]